jgi:arylsulfatase A-like enzyme
MSRYKRVKDYIAPARRKPVLSRMRALYAAEVTMTDRWLSVLVERLYSLGLERDTVVMLVSDHGYLLGEHGWTGKIASMLHPPLMHVPFVIVDPSRRRAGRSADYLAQTHDLGPTLLDMTDVKRPERMNGTSLAPLLRGERPRERRSMAYGGYANWHYARTGRWGYVAANTGKGRRVYDLRRDPGEHRNLARRHPNLIDLLEKRVRREAGGRLPVYD